jgi:hypothetical protein
MMQILYQDEYGEQLYLSESGYIPAIGDTVNLDDEDWRVRSRTFIPMQSVVVIELTQNMIKSSVKDDDNSGRLAEMQNAIMATNKRQDGQDKKHRLLSEQLVSMRTFLRNKK